MSTRKASSEKSTLAILRRELARLDVGHDGIVFGSLDRPPFDDVAGIEQAHEVAQIADLLIGIVDRHRRDAEHLIAAGAAHRIDAAEAAAMADGQLRRVGARAQIFRRLDLPLALDHLVEERQAGDEADHRDEPGRAGMRPDEAFDAVEMVDLGGIFDVGHLRRLVAVAEAHQGLARPGIVVEHGNLDDARRRAWRGRPRPRPRSS